MWRVGLGYKLKKPRNI